mmetsp:Transcript_53283/g.127103  ORF Transcript_53283/g.127103 Transcript_53283/m.127103 type:complete len:239 (+) Transcript_53283:69-785(+)
MWSRVLGRKMIAAVATVYHFNQHAGISSECPPTASFHALCSMLHGVSAFFSASRNHFPALSAKSSTECNSFAWRPVFSISSCASSYSCSRRLYSCSFLAVVGLIGLRGLLGLPGADPKESGLTSCPRRLALLWGRWPPPPPLRRSRSLRLSSRFPSISCTLCCCCSCFFESWRCMSEPPCASAASTLRWCNMAACLGRSSSTNQSILRSRKACASSSNLHCRAALTSSWWCFSTLSQL